MAGIRRRQDVPKFVKSEYSPIYSVAPKKEYTIAEWRELAEKRLDVLKEFDPEAPNLTKLLKLVNDPAQDAISHFLLALAFCKNSEDRDWLIQSERKLFEYRWKTASDSKKTAITKDLISVKSASSLTKEQAINQGLSGRFPIKNLQRGDQSDKENWPIHVVPFQEVQDLVSSRRVYIQDGKAYVPNTMFKSYISGRYRAYLSERMSKARKNIHLMKVGDQKRLEELVHQISSYRSKKLSVEISDVLKPKDVNAASSKFPLCMRVMQRHLVADSHLKHMGRLYYGTFLKNCGMTCDDALAYFQKIFTKKITPEKFSKDYRYGIRHLYGLEGKKKVYSALTCRQIVGQDVKPGEYHGCPYKTYDKKNLSKLLRGCGLTESQIKEAANQAEGGHYLLACRTFFEATHSKQMKKKNQTIEDIESTWMHPNAYYSAAVSVYEECESKMDTNF